MPLIGPKAKIDARNVNGATPLYNAAHNGHGAVVKVLLEANANVKLKDLSGETPETVAARRGHDYVSELLRRHRAR